MSLYENFLKTGNIVRFDCGAESTSFEKKGKLKNALNQKGSERSKERIERLKKMLRESKTGCAALDMLEKAQSNIVFEDMKYYGYFSPERNVVALNPKNSDEDLAVTFVHEMRHVWQDSVVQCADTDQTPKTFLMSNFAIEADACAAEVMFAHEMRDKNPALWAAHQKTKYAPMSTAFEKTLAETKDENKAREAAFFEWYKLPVTKEYAEEYAAMIAFDADRSSRGKTEQHEHLFKTDVSAKDFLGTVCANGDNGNYMTHPERAESAECLTIDEKSATKILDAMKIFTKRIQRTDTELGLDKIFVRKGDNRTENLLDFRKAGKKRGNFNAFATQYRDGR